MDRKLDRILDLEDATKVGLEGDRVIDIGKSLRDYSAVDTGMFFCRPALFDALQASLRNGDCSLSDGMRFLAWRSTLPYAILAFALVDFMDFVLFMSTLGANLIWTITLYSNRVFRRDPAPKIVPPSEMRCKEEEGAR